MARDTLTDARRLATLTDLRRQKCVAELARLDAQIEDLKHRIDRLLEERLAWSNAIGTLGNTARLSSGPRHWESYVSERVKEARMKEAALRARRVRLAVTTHRASAQAEAVEEILKAAARHVRRRQNR
ncbi:MAG: hypothetical protein AAFR35_13390 [Pseudomonadota bacterium]